MRRTDQNFYSMSTVTLSVLKDYPAALASIPALQTEVNKLAGTAARISAAQLAQDVRSEGYTEQKRSLARKAITLACHIAGLVQTYAQDADDMPLYRQFRISPSSLGGLADDLLPERLQALLKGVQAIGLGPLADYGLDQQLVSDYSAAVAAYADKRQQPRKVIATRKTQTTEIGLCLKAQRKALRRVDKLILGLQGKVPELVSRYFNARIVIDLGGRKGAGG